MKFIEKFFFILFPLAILKGTPWEAIWEEQEKKEFFLISKIFFSITLFGYVLHYYTVDVAEGLAPSDLWFNYRYGMASVSLACLFLYNLNIFENNFKYYRIPAIVAGALFCYFQTRTIIWYPKVPYLYTFGFIFVCTLILRSTILKSVSVALFYTAIVFPTLLEAGLSPAMGFSAGFFTIAIVVFARSKYATDLKFFYLTQKNIQQQKKFIETNLEFTNQIKAFLPAVISKRLNEYIQNQRMSVVQAIDEVLRPKQQKVACIFTDIRGFTKGSNDLHGFVSKAMLPNVKASSEAIEKYNGIPRKIGDLIFAYFDYENPAKCIEMAMQAAVELAKISYDLNDGMPTELKIKRFILIGFGEAIVGNLSGYESSIEITAIGKPVNFLSRLDELTKAVQFKDMLQSGDILIAPDMADVIAKQFPSFELQEIDLEELSLSIRDFSEVKKVYLFRLSEVFSAGLREAS